MRGSPAGFLLVDAIPADTTKTAIIGGSLTRGYGVNVSEAYASLLEAPLQLLLTATRCSA
jgi:hypothetical protein